MPLIQVPDPGRKLEKQYGLESDPAPFLAGELVPVVVVDDLTSSSLDLQLESAARPCVGFHTAAAGGAGFRSECALTMPLNTNIIASIEALVVTSPTAAARVTIVTAAPSGATVNTNKGFRDRRLAGAPAGVLTTKNTAAATTGTSIGRVLVPTTVESIIVPGPWYLGPGNSLMVRPDADNLAVEVTWYWREVRKLA